jgi:ribosomal protein L40E
MKLCPQCEKENPSSANYCMHCGCMLFESELRTKIKELEQSIKELEQRIRKLEPQVKEYGLYAGKLEKQPQIAEKQPQLTCVPEKATVSPNVVCLYADAIINGAFHRVSEQPNEDTVFELLVTSSARTTQQFRIYSEACKRVLKNPDFVDGCDKQRISAQPQNLEVEPGETVQDEFGKWKIIKKVKVKFV